MRSRSIAFDGAFYTWVTRREKSDQRNHQQTGVELGTPVILHECVSLLVETLMADFVVYLSTHLAPALDGAWQPKVFDGFDHAIHSDPGHDLRMSKVSLRTAHFPDAVIRLTPRLFQVISQSLLDAPGVLIWRQPPTAGQSIASISSP